MSTQPPRRSDVHDPCFNPKIGARIEIMLDGAPQTKVIAYDCDAGTVLRFVTDEAGRIVLAEDRSAVLKETLTGTVEVRWKEGRDNA